MLDFRPEARIFRTWAKSWQTPRRSANDMGGVVEAVVAPIS
jgi:hypothetical protein